MPLLLRVASVALLLTACTAQAPTTPGGTSPQAGESPSDPRADATAGDTTPSATDPAWTDAGRGLSVRLEVPPAPQRLGTEFDLSLHFRNDSPQDMRVYLVDTPIFRAQQSDLTLFTADNEFLDSQPEPHPHGYVVTERDFRLIAPGATITHSQPLRLDPERIGAHTDLRVRWTYSNKVESWAGGVQTLDGPTKSLFGGGRIPGIWLGEVQTTANLEVAR